MRLPLAGADAFKRIENVLRQLGEECVRIALYGFRGNDVSQSGIQGCGIVAEPAAKAGERKPVRIGITEFGQLA